MKLKPEESKHSANDSKSAPLSSQQLNNTKFESSISSRDVMVDELHVVGGCTDLAEYNSLSCQEDLTNIEPQLSIRISSIDVSNGELNVLGEHSKSQASKLVVNHHELKLFDEMPKKELVGEASEVNASPFQEGLTEIEKPQIFDEISRKDLMERMLNVFDETPRSELLENDLDALEGMPKEKNATEKYLFSGYPSILLSQVVKVEELEFSDVTTLDSISFTVMLKVVLFIGNPGDQNLGFTVDPTEPSITIALHHGGQFSNRVPIYIGGSVSKFDYVDMNRLGFDYLDKLCEVLGYMGHKRYYNLQPHGMYFSSKSEFRKAFRSHAIRTRRNLKIIKNDLRRIYGKCAEAGCQWKIHVLAVGGESSFQVRDYNPKHSCGGMFHVKNCNSTWLGNKYEKSFRTDPKRNVKGWRQDVIEDINVHVSKNQAYRAKWRALKNIEGDPKDQYGRLWDYAEELRTSNPGSTVILTLAPDDGSGTPKFGKFYVCFKGVKDGFLSGCRKLIGVDGCHLKGPHGGILLAAVGIDPNNNSYPICYAVVNRETKESWEWFLTLLKFDLKIENDSEWTFLSDKQKGLIPAFEIVFPGSDNRFCVRHLFGNMKTAGFRGKAYKRAVWKAARASTISEFECRMQEMTKLDKNVVEWLHDKPPVNWSKSHFNTFSKCDLLLNNLCESFNSNILDAREKMILSMLEWIRAWLMGRLQENRDRCAKRWKGKICPKIKFLLMRNDEKTRDCIPLKATDYHYEIACPDGNCKVDLEKHTCSCRKWELSGIPCKHAICAINCQRLDPQDFVHPCYSVETYARVYMHCIYPVNGQEKWRKTGQVPLIPPNLGRGVGRPPSARRLEIGDWGQEATSNGPNEAGRGQEPDWEQISMEVSNIESSIQGLKDKGKGKQTEAVPRKAGLSIRIQKNAPSTMTETRATFSILRSNSKQDSHLLLVRGQ
ncbi:hypothetical protein BUALT_Bualt03G0164200 [Buddleja alternifolia]|uniref:SWIM-type domain-containing protein n=1 Tax=Buddleja alternifolia TaxID=168488 RepID=A0AAV6XU95_9LAMI|nr:hypothetical protein BUALT_Bualt03G0164200 [Buddleja alternifolia]